MVTLDVARSIPDTSTNPINSVLLPPVSLSTAPLDPPPPPQPPNAAPQRSNSNNFLYTFSISALVKHRFQHP